MTDAEGDPRIADTLDETCHDLQELSDRVDDDEAEDHLQLAISHLEHVSRWDREERGETPTDALRDFVTDGGVDQDDGEQLDRGMPDPDDINWGPPTRPLEEGDPCPVCDHPFDGDEWDIRKLPSGPTIGETWVGTCLNCEKRTYKVGT